MWNYKKYLLLIIPFVFFFGCEQNEDTSCSIVWEWKTNDIEYSNGNVTCLCNYSATFYDNIHPGCPESLFAENGYVYYQYIGQDGMLYSYNGSWIGECDNTNNMSIEFGGEPDKVIEPVLNPFTFVSQDTIIFNNLFNQQVVYLSRIN